MVICVAPNLFHYNAAILPWNVFGFLIGSVYETQKAAILVLIQNSVCNLINRASWKAREKDWVLLQGSAVSALWAFEGAP